MKVDLMFWRQFDSKVKIGKYKKGFKTYDALTKAVRDWASLRRKRQRPDDYVLVECIEKTHGGPYGPRGMICSLGAALGVCDAYNGLVQLNWGHPIAQKKDDDDHFGWTDEVIDLYADHDGGYLGVDPALYHSQRKNSPSPLDSTTRYRYEF
jgi:hypothetical protein